MYQKELPLVSFVLLAYNQEGFIEEAVNGAFSQNYSPLEIILSDDCSKDKTFSIMEKLASSYTGPHKVILRRNSRNLGIGGHYNEVINIAAGEIIELAAGDDISLPHRTLKSCEILANHPDLMCVSLGLHHFRTDPYGGLELNEDEQNVTKYELTDFVENSHFYLNAPARAFRKFTHNYFGPILSDCPVEDGPNMLRCLLHGKAGYCPVKGVLYREHGNNYSSPENLTKVPFPLIYKEYHHTILKAYEKGLISLKNLDWLQRRFTHRQQKWEILNAYNKSKRRAVEFLTRILLSRHLSMKEKVKLLKSCVTVKAN